MEVTKAPDGKMSALWARSNAALGETVSKNIPRGIFKDRRDAIGGVFFATPPIYLQRGQNRCVLLAHK